MAGVGAQRAVEISKWWERVKSWRASHFSLEQRALLKNSKILLSALKFVFYPRSERFRRLQKMIVLLRYLPWSHETDDIRDIEEAFVSFTGTHFPSELKLSSHGVLGVHPMASRLSQSKCHPFSHAVSGSDSTWKLSSYSLQIWPGLPWHPGATLVSLSAANTAGAVCRGPRTPSPAYLTAHELPVQLDGSSSSCSASFPPHRTRGHHTLPSHASLTHPSRVTGPGARFKFIVLFCATVFAPVVISDFPSQWTAFEPLILFSEIVS